MAGKKGCFSSLITIVIILMVIGFIMDFFGGPKIEGDTAFIKMDLYLTGAAKNKEWADDIWTAVKNDDVKKVIIRAEGQYKDKYGKSETYKKEIDITSLISPFSEVRNYTQAKFSQDFGDYIVDWVSDKMSAYANS